MEKFTQKRKSQAAEIVRYSWLRIRIRIKDKSQELSRLKMEGRWTLKMGGVEA